MSDWIYSFFRTLTKEVQHKNGVVQARRYDGSNNPGLTSTTVVNDGQFHHVAFVKQGEILTLYIDGVGEAQTTDTTSASTANTAPVYLGTRNGSKYFKGTIDDLRIYASALSESEVAELASNAPAHPYEDTMYYRFKNYHFNSLMEEWIA